MPDSLYPVFLTIAIAGTVALSLVVISALMGRPRRSTVDVTPYECGSKPFESTASQRFSVKFYIVAMLFILFDIETAFMIPWAVTFRSFAQDKLFVLGEMAIFLGILVAGFVYVWWRGALEWE